MANENATGQIAPSASSSEKSPIPAGNDALNASDPSSHEPKHHDVSLPAAKKNETPNNTISTNEEAPPGPSGPPPPTNDHLVAWLQVLGGFMLFFNTWGILTSFGVFQTYYESEDLFNRPSSDISWIGSIQAFLIQFGGIASGPIYDRGHLRILLGVGSFCIVFGHIMLSIAGEYWQVILAQGLCVGIGMGCLFVPCISVIPAYFTTRMGLAIGIASAGTALGGVVYPIVLHQLLDSVGFAWSVRVMGFIALATLAVPISVMKMRFKPAKPRAIIDVTAFTDMPYMWFAISTLIGFMGLTAFQFYFSFYSKDRNITSTGMAFDLVPIYNAASAVGRIIPNYLSDKIGPFNVLAPSICLTGIVYFCTMATHSEGGIIVITIIAGFFSGVFTAMPPVCFATLIKDKSRIGTRIGMGFAMTSFGLLIGGPGGGAILGKTEPLNWTGLWTFAGVMASVSGLLYVGLRVSRSGFKLAIKA